MRSSFTRSALLAGAAVLTPLSAGVAQDQASAPDDETDVIIVRGIRAGVEASIDAKRSASQIVDVISSEDIGKLPDENVAEALQRVTGVQISRVFGEGQTVAIRGLEQTRTSIDGRTLVGFSVAVSPPAAPTLGRSSGLDVVPSGLFSQLEVLKSPQADQVEGGLGGVVNLVTPDPFDFNERTIGFGIQGIYSEGSEEVEPKLSAFVADSFLDGRLGLLAAVDFSGRTSTLQAFERNNFLARNVDGVAGNDALVPTRVRYEDIVADRERLGFSLDAQFQATENLELFGEYLFSSLENATDRNILNFNFNPTGVTPSATVDNVPDGDGALPAFVAGDVTLNNFQTLGIARDEPVDTQLFAAGGTYTTPKFEVFAEASYSLSEREEIIDIARIQQDTNAASRGDLGPVTGSFDFTAGDVPSFTLDNPAEFTDLSLYRPTLLRSDLDTFELDETAFKADFTYFLGGAFPSVKTGVRYRELGYERVNFRNSFANSLLDPADATLRSGDLFDDVDGVFPRPFPVVDFAGLEAYGDTERTRQVGGSDTDIEETSFALYGMAEFDTQLGGVATRGNFGVRYVTTDLTVDSFANLGGGNLVLVTNENDYTNVLPSANVTFELAEDLLVRASAARVMQRAPVDQLTPALGISAVNATASGGNPNLDPIISDQFDVSVEWYFANAGLLSGAVFHKDISDQLLRDTTFVPFSSLGIPLVADVTPDTEFALTTPLNAEDATVTGFEIGYQQAFDMLPGPLSGLGVIANYTYADGEFDSGLPFVGLSENSYNLIGYYENGPFETRLAYNYRDKAAFDNPANRVEFIDELANLDFQAGYDINDNFTLTFQAVNLLPEESAIVEYRDPSTDLLNSYALSERRYFFGIRGRL